MTHENYTEAEQLRGGSLRRLRRLIPRTALTNPTNGGSQDLDLAESLGGIAGQLVRHRLLKDALLVGVHVTLIEAFTGGGATSVSVSLGTSSQPTAIMQAFDVRGSAPGPAVDGNRTGSWRVVPADSLVIARFGIDGAHNLAALTAGAVQLDVLFAPAPGRP